MILRLALFVLGAGALFLSVRMLRMAGQGRIRVVNTVRWADNPGLFCVYVCLAFFLLLAGVFTVSRAMSGLT
ncbi:hypothetical protein [Phenylobacterium sp.]|jgi:hypothetical protein|uniref:hypothetical protein n=1 Tax=Phenylobacterium sp. TaxID=1871053 RepID=UPI002F95661E